MRRGTLLWALGAGAAGIAGCSGSPDTEPAASTPADSSTTAGPPTTAPTTSEEASDAEPAPEPVGDGGVRLLSIEPPEPAQIGESVEYRFTVENPGEESRTAEPTVMAHSGGSAWTAHERWSPVELPPGGRHTFESAPFTREFLSTVELRIDPYGPRFRAEFTERRLSFAEEYRDPLDRDVSVEDLDVYSVYEYTKDGTRRVVGLDDESQFVFVTIDVVNRTDQPLDAPERTEFSLVAGERSFHPVRMPDDGDYEPDEIQWGARTGGRVAYKTPESLSRGELQVGWYASFDGGDVGVIWTPE